jgi:hypothetical protein
LHGGSGSLTGRADDAFTILITTIALRYADETG